MEPVKGLLGRFLMRRLVETECGVGARDSDLARVVDWLPRVWHHLNQFLETHSSSDVTIGWSSHVHSFLAFMFSLFKCLLKRMFYIRKG